MGQSALHIACYKNNLRTIEYIVRDLDIDPNLLLKSETRSNCLHLAVRGGNFGIIQFLIENSKVNLR